MLKLARAPVPGDLDLRYLPDMPLSVGILRDSGIASVGNPEVFRCAVLLWCAAWHQVPAGSLPSDAATLARLAGLGRDVRGWAELEADVLRGFAAGPDGLLYHRVVCERAVEVHNKMAKGRWRKACEQVRYRNKSKPEGQKEALPIEPIPVIYDWSSAGEEPVSAVLSAGNSDNSSGNSGGVPAETPKSPPRVRRSSGGNSGKGKERKGKEGSEEASSASARARRRPAPKVEAKPAAPVVADTSAAARAFAAYNQCAQAQGWRPAQFLNSTVRVQLDACLDLVDGMPGWMDALIAASGAKFFRLPDGKPQPWFCLDWLLKQDNFRKLMEGAYAERFPTAVNPPVSFLDTVQNLADLTDHANAREAGASDYAAELRRESGG